MSSSKNSLYLFRRLVDGNEYNSMADNFDEPLYRNLRLEVVSPNIGSKLLRRSKIEDAQDKIFEIRERVAPKMFVTAISATHQISPAKSNNLILLEYDDATKTKLDKESEIVTDVIGQGDWNFYNLPIIYSSKTEDQAENLVTRLNEHISEAGGLNMYFGRPVIVSRLSNAI